MDKYIGTPVYFDFAALVLVLFLFFAIITKKLYRTNTSKAFIVLASFLLLTIVFDIVFCFNKVLDICNR